jgi:hypothetical protein
MMQHNLYLMTAAVLLLTVLTACGAVQPSEPAAEGTAHAAGLPATSAPTATTATEPTEPATASPDPEAEVSAVDASAPDETEAVAEASGHSCDDPFAGDSTVRFSPDLWTAEGISRYVSPEIVDPASGLATNFCLTSIDYGDILSGGPPPDGIPPIDNPEFETVTEGDEWLAGVQPVISLVVNGEAKAYPLAILTWHEIANDEIAGIPVAVTFCPLCNAAIVFNRTVDGETLRFGVSGNLRNSDLVMWDNKTLSWWQQFTGEGIVGDKTGTQLEIIPSQLVAWEDFKTAYPDGRVLARGGARNYGTNPYANYDSTTNPFLFLGTPDPRLKATERVLGYHKGETAVAYPLTVIADEKVIQDTIDGQNVVIFFEPGQVSALDNASIERSKEVGSAAMFLSRVDGQNLTFDYAGGKIVDNETGSEWDVFGRAVAGELTGVALEPVLSHPHFWFAWAAFRPDTALYEG